MLLCTGKKPTHENSHFCHQKPCERLCHLHIELKAFNLARNQCMRDGVCYPSRHGGDPICQLGNDLDAATDDEIQKQKPTETSSCQ
jgi:hypothetical protein